MQTFLIVLGFSMVSWALGYYMGRLHELMNIISDDREWKREP